MVLLIFSFGCGGETRNYGDPNEVRLITIGGSVTETAFALGAGKNIVGTDTSSIFPEQAVKLPQVGYQRQLSAEGVLSLRPTLILATEEAGTPAAIRQIENAGVKVIKVPNDNSAEGARAQIRLIAETLDRTGAGEELVGALENDLKEANRCRETIGRRPKVLFIHARGGAMVNVAGTKTAGDEMIKLAGGENVITQFEGYKPLTAETIVSVQPDLILMPEKSLESIGGDEGLLKISGIGETPAGKNRRIITLDDLMLLGFGPRLGQAVKSLCEKLH